MGSTQNWTSILSFYFVALFVIVSLFSVAGQFSNDVNISSNNFETSNLEFNQTDAPISSVTAIFNWGEYFEDVFSFFAWNINVTGSDHEILGQFFWVFRAFFVYLPLLFLILSVYYSLPTVSG